MDFFTAQDHARRKTGHLVILLILAVLALIAVTTLVIAIAVHLMGGVQPSGPPGSPQTVDLSVQGLASALTFELVAGVAAVVLAIVVLGSLFKQMQLSRGGRAVAEALGGREINLNTRDADERRILNVVEEMAIASGTPVPSVYVLEDESINAFAAGHRPGNAVIGITRGTIRNLTREELQGVVAHEFSHIMHGDMRLNMRLVSVLHGILVIGLLGGTLLRSMRYRRIGGGRRDNSAVAILGMGAALMLIGYAGTFFGNLIKSAVSRQREYLADASAVQFTRNPQGIGGALVKVGTHTRGSYLEAAQAAEFSHLFFGQGLRLGFNRMMATHPPIEDRIKRVMPDWDGRFQVTWPTAQAETETASEDSAKDSAKSARTVGMMAGAAVLTGASARSAIGAMGQPDQRHLDLARATLDALPESIRTAAHEPFAARALMYALLLSQDREVRARQLQSLEQAALPDVYRELQHHAQEVLLLDDQLRLPLVELALPALKSLSEEQARHFRHCMGLLIKADGQVSLFEWTLYQMLLHNMSERDTGSANRKLKDLQPECQVLLSVLAAAGQDDPAEIHAALHAAEKELPFALAPTEEPPGMGALNQAVEKLRRLRPLQKPALLKAMARCIEHSGEIRPAEAELFRAVADMLDCPMPPLLTE
ncbi:peptidase [Natronospirillum operosum]|uniref:Peptidase n=1 Tax=Natronospirillum operosum TaxID=2759953 RepID=A0A4Z0W901_9GAMM|nr:M48 family metallopeptidase [Natronospirillum operosum]TGG95089.1 peptidase [Natronospirillum operosum]